MKKHFLKSIVVTATCSVSVAWAADYHHVLSTGQSLSIGGGSAGVLSTTQPYNNLMLTSTIVNGNYTLAPRTETHPQESHNSGFANSLSFWAGEAGYRTLTSGHGRGGQSYVNIKKNTAKACTLVSVGYTGTGAYCTGLGQMISGQQAIAAQGDTYHAPKAVLIVHGEQDGIDGTSYTIYQNYMKQFRNDYQTDITAITGSTDTVKMYHSQMSSFTALSTTGTSPQNANVPYIALAQSRVAELYPNEHVMVMPKYFLPYRNALHLTKQGYRWMGEYYAKAYKKIAIDGQVWKPLSPLTAVGTGNVITLTLHVPSPPLVLDTSLVAFKDNYGFEFYDNSGSTPTITNVALLGSNQVQITLSATPTGSNKRIRYAYSGTQGAYAGPAIAIAGMGNLNIPLQAGSARGNLRDSDATPSLYNNNLYNWAIHFDRVVNY